MPYAGKPCAYICLTPFHYSPHVPDVFFFIQTFCCQNRDIAEEWKRDSQLCSALWPLWQNRTALHSLLEQHGGQRTRRRSTLLRTDAHDGLLAVGLLAGDGDVAALLQVHPHGAGTARKVGNIAPAQDLMV